MDFSGGRLELESTEEERTYTLVTGNVRPEWIRKTKFDCTLNGTFQTISKSIFTICCCIFLAVCFCLQNDELMLKFSYAHNKKYQLWRIITYAFLHSNLYHLVPNLLFYCLVGIILERDQGLWRTITVYVTGIISGAFGCNVFAEKRRVIGTSAASYSLLMAHIIHLNYNWTFTRHKDYRVVAITCLLFSDIMSFFLSSFLFKNITVAWSSHFFAGLNGLLISSVIFSSSKPCHTYRYIALFIYVALMTFSLLIYIPWLTSIVCEYSVYNY